MKTTASNKKIRELVTSIGNGSLVPRPEFQRRTVWTREDKVRFIQTVLLGFPFPEIYLADGETDLETAAGTQLLVDGQQRVTTLHQYFHGDPSLGGGAIPPYQALDEVAKVSFLAYDVAVRDLGALSKDQIVEVFRRINATNYSLNPMEINNAVYAGALKRFAEEVAALEFFETHRTFRSSDLRRMGDLRYALTIVITMLEGYFNRDEAFEDALRQFNDDFPVHDEILQRLTTVIDFIEECGFTPTSRIWKKADLFTAFIELDVSLYTEKVPLQPSDVVERLHSFYSAVESADPQVASAPSIYYKASLQASNDRINRVRRGVIVNAVMQGESADEALASEELL